MLLESYFNRSFNLFNELSFIPKHNFWRRDVVVTSTAQLHSAKSKRTFCTGLNAAHGVLETDHCENLWWWSWLEIRCSTFRRLVSPQKQFIVIHQNKRQMDLLMVVSLHKIPKFHLMCVSTKLSCQKISSNCGTLCSCIILESRLEIINSFFCFFYLGFLSWTFTIHRTAGKGGVYLFNSIASQTLRH